MAITLTPSQMAAHGAVAQTAELQHNLEHLDWKLGSCAGTSGVTTGEATP